MAMKVVTTVTSRTRLAATRPPSPSLLKKAALSLITAYGTSLDLDGFHLPDGPGEILLVEQGGIGVERVNDEDRALLSHRHRPAVELGRENDRPLAKILGRDLGSVVVEGDYAELDPLCTDGV